MRDRDKELFLGLCLLVVQQARGLPAPSAAPAFPLQVVRVPLTGGARLAPALSCCHHQLLPEALGLAKVSWDRHQGGLVILGVIPFPGCIPVSLPAPGYFPSTRCLPLILAEVCAIHQRARPAVTRSAGAARAARRQQKETSARWGWGLRCGAEQGNSISPISCPKKLLPR